MSAFEPLKEPLAEAIQQGDQEQAAKLAQQAIDAGVDPKMIFDESIVPTLKEVGDRFSRLEIFLPEMMLSADAAKAVIALLDPILKAQQAAAILSGTVVIGTVAGDVHDIGKNMVASMMEVSGFKVIDLGTDVSVQDFLKTARAQEADIIAMSSLLTTSLPYMKDVLAVLQETGENATFKVMVGGGPVTSDWAAQVGADGYGKDASEAVTIARKLVGAGSPSAA